VEIVHVEQAYYRFRRMDRRERENDEKAEYCQEEITVNHGVSAHPGILNAGKAA
jgi:hypothetical protein